MGRQEAHRDLIIDNLEAEYGKLPEELLARLSTITDPELLNELTRASARAESLEAFRQRLGD
ncbi:MAG: hypothetical protein K0Q72_1859 [Armatimonadetes bacterium]|jgi:hypothetical protein|nr:hypothetical protein [Armatimonadota bacterium]